MKKTSITDIARELKRILKSYICQRVDGVIIWSDYPTFPYSEEIASYLHISTHLFL